MPRRHTAMNFISTRGNTPPTSIDTPLVPGLAPDGGLYVPERIPRIALDRPLPTPADTTQAVLAPYFAASSLPGALSDVCSQTFSFGAPLGPLLGDGAYLLELLQPPPPQ